MIRRLSSKRGLSRALVAISGQRRYSSRPDISKVLVANRGEIACRVIRTCKRLGIPTVAVYSVADGPNALHARMADEALLIGDGPAASESYLLQDEVLRIANETQAEAIHPGYGFLSENAGFASSVDQAGLTFIGPPASAIVSMGSKSQSKAIMEEAGVPTTPGHYGDENQNADYLKDKAINAVGFPLLIKAVSGGGGKGMRLVWNESEFFEALESCQRESLASFGDESVLLEKYLVRPRHVEVQVVADSHGNVVHLYERDCSLQRRHQKIIEEAPASDLDQSIRERLGEMGKRAAQAVGYVNAGTVEFLLDTNEPDKFYFCEMNTRLQVEHPITEQITGVDLVEWQLRIAAGEELLMAQADIPCVGHAFEARIYAENPARNFLPATGRVWHHKPPAAINGGMSDDGVRVDTGLQAGQDVGVYYDPMISKLITHGGTRQDALGKLTKALKNYQIAGVPTNIGFLVKCAQHPVFGQAGSMNTGFLEDYAQDVKVEEESAPPALARSLGAFAAILVLEGRVGEHGGLPLQPTSPWSTLSGSWRLGGELGRARRTLLLKDGSSLDLVCNRDGSFEVEIDSDVVHVSGDIRSDGRMEVTLNHSKRIEVHVALDEDDVIRVRMWPKGLDDFNWKVNFRHPFASSSSESDVAAGGHGLVTSPMPGKVKLVNFSLRDVVSEGDVVLVLEAMKMEHSIKAPCAGVLTKISGGTGDVVEDGAALFFVDASGDELETGSDDDGAQNVLGG